MHAGPALAVAHVEPANALSLPTWAIHISSTVEWGTAMLLFWKYADVSGAPYTPLQMQAWTRHSMQRLACSASRTRCCMGIAGVIACMLLTTLRGKGVFAVMASTCGLWQAISAGRG